ncbi:hypothetical protein LCGC14_2305010 [marine sediment metagenome]|uniref:Glyoxalase/fosfomycin resistance/dioxygenase domain-containing protein n=2 Tax=marine sediment metagenome TaxID=412755 RepID=A0A0F9CMS8_9ZZZZ
MKLRHVGYPVNDMKKHVTFWKSKGARIIYEATEQIQVIKFDNGIELIKYLGPEGMIDRPHVAFTLDPDENIIELVEDVK